MADSSHKASSDEAAVRSFLNTHPQVQVIIVQWVDICGIVRSRMTSAQRFLALVASGGAFNETPLDMLMHATADIIPEIFDHFCDERGRLVPDISSLRVAAHDAANIGNVATVVAEGDWLGIDARANLRRLVQEAETQHDLRFIMGFELELCFLEQHTSLTPAGPAFAGVGDSSITHRSAIWPILNEVVVALAEADILVEQVIKEYGPSQWELALPPLPPVESVDAYVYAREVIKNIAHKHGVVATFYPTPYSGDGSGQKSGQHIHVSAKVGGSDGTDGSWNPDELMAGVLSHVPALMAVGMPQIDSYSRVGAAAMATGGVVGWGEHNRDMPVRRIHKNHWEIRANDACSNPYAMAAGIIAAALDRKPLTIKPANKWTPFITQEEFKELGQTKLLPKTLEEAIVELETDRVWAEKALGKEYIRWFLTVKRAEIKAISSLEVDQRRTTMFHHF